MEFCTEIDHIHAYKLYEILFAQQLTNMAVMLIFLATSVVFNVESSASALVDTT